MMHRISALSLLTLPALVAGLSGWAAVPAAAAGFSVPEGCNGQMTVQMRGCIVGQYFSCSADPAGSRRSVLYDSDGAFFATLVDDEYQWLESVDLVNAITDRLQSPSADPASFSALLESGQDSYDFTTLSSGGETRRYRGEDRLSGGSVTIDGVTLEATSFALLEESPAGTTRRHGRQYISRDWRMFFSGPEVIEAGDDRLDIDNTPVSFAFPGDAGYLSTVPVYDCGLMSRAVTGRPEALPALFRTDDTSPTHPQGVMP